MNCCDAWGRCTRGADCPAGSDAACPPCNGNCSQGDLCPARVALVRKVKPYPAVPPDPEDADAHQIGGLLVDMLYGLAWAFLMVGLSLLAALVVVGYVL